jgi:hypothetical protein
LNDDSVSLEEFKVQHRALYPPDVEAEAEPDAEIEAEGTEVTEPPI